MQKVFAILFLLFAAFSVAKADTPQVSFKPYEFETDEGKKVQAELGELVVPQNRNGKSSRTIKLRFVRFSATAKRQIPIVYLAGGPGGSGIDAARGSRFPLFMALREFGDVIALDQRGIGMSEPDLSCNESFFVPLSEPINRPVAGKILADAAKNCFDRLEKQGIDLTAYNTRENAADLNDLRIALHAPRLTLWGISYGTHLALAAMKYHGEFIDRVILAGVEPLHQTYKLPSDQQKLLAEIAQLAKKDPKISAVVPDLMSSIQQLLKRLEHEPQVVSLTHPENGKTAQVKVGKFDLQYALAGMLVGPETFAGMPDFISRLEHGDWTALALLSAQNRIGETSSAMSIAMDCASGASDDWLKKIAQEASKTMLSDAINFPFPEICPAGLDLGDDFRKPVTSNIPALLISGTLDGRTPPSNAEAVAAHLKNSQHLVIEGAGHSDPLFLSSPQILEAMKTFLRGKSLQAKRISVQTNPLLPPRKIAPVSEDTLEQYAGTYKINDKESRRVLKAGNVLYTQRGSGPPRPIRPLSQTEFFYEGSLTWLRFDLNPQGKVTGMTVFQEGRTPGESALRIQEQSSSNSKQQLEKEVDSYLNEYLKGGFFSGVVFIAKKGEVLLRKGYGFANYEFQIPNTPETKLHIASVSKPFTSAAILLLQQKKLLNVNDPLSKFIPDYPNGDKILLHHLLTHTSGIPNVNDFPDYDAKSKFPQKLDTIISWFKNAPLEFEPGAKYSYSNSNYNLLAFIIEKVSGKSYGGFLNENIFQPLQMVNTAHDSNSARVIPGAASGYVPVGINEIEKAAFLEWSIKTGNGSLYSTVDDLYKWDRALYGEKILPKSVIDEIYEKKYGWFTGDRFGKKRVYMNGRSPGFNSYLERYIDDDVCIILLCNQYTALAHTVIADLASIVFSQKYELPKPFVTLPAEALQKYAGTYVFGSDFYRPGPVEVKVIDGKLMGVWGEFKSGLIPFSESDFCLLAFWSRIEFVRDKNGKIIQMIYHEGETKYIAERK